ncbi:MAG: glutathione S-transferase [Proteobacteria bacterium]|nr:glutathione S-transferase [Pseudomonadota bacterium]NOG59286.1 glutathione S-transferase [Pseudomonadota bacterium]
MKAYPVLYSFRRCPYAMRARMAISKANIKCELREVVLKDKPESMLLLSDKGTVPVLLTPDKEIIEQSTEVMHWALNQNDPDNWLNEDASQSQYLIDYNDNEFKHFLDRYKYHVGYPEHSQVYYRENAESFLKLIEKQLCENKGVALLGNRITFADIAIFPFIRQFSKVDIDWFQASPYELLKKWIANLEKSELFQNCMKKYAQWQPEQTPVYFPV